MVLSHAHVAALAGGYVGVDVFFVISGFLITGLLIKDAAHNGRVNFVVFYARRARRILPVATVVIVTTTLASIRYLNFVRAKAVLTDSVWATFFAANIRFARQGTDYFAQTLPPSPLQHYWSLAVEEQFYLVWPALMAVALFGVYAVRSRHHGTHFDSRPQRLLRGRVALVLLAVGAASLYLSVHQTATDPSAAYFSTFTRAWELSAGALLATTLPVLPPFPDWLRVIVGWSGLAGIAAAAVVYNASTPFPGDAALLPVLGTCAVIAAGSGTSPQLGVQQLLARRPMQFVGDISYSLYLWHWPILILAAGYAGHTLSVGADLALVGLAVLLSTASYYLVENPFRRSTRLFGRRPYRGLILWPVAVTSVVLVWALANPVAPGTGLTADREAAVPATDNAVEAVKEAVLAAERGAPIPVNLSPPYDRMTTDSIDLGDCVGWHKTSSKICYFGDPTGSKRMVVFGNSHSEMWMAALRPIDAAAGWQLVPVLKEACDYVDYVSLSGAQCHVWYLWAKKTIQSLHPDLIVLGVYDHNNWQIGIRQILRDFSAPGRRIVLLSDAPAVNMIPRDCLLGQGATLRTCMRVQPPWYFPDDQEARAIATQANVEFVDVAPWFCYNQLCPSVIDSKVPNLDGWHLTNTYARYLIPELRPYLHLSTPAPRHTPS